jgi:predicted transport protein
LNSELEQEFKVYFGKGEIYKAIKEIVENSKNILIVIDENKPEFQEIMETYTDTWDKMVKIEILKQYTTSDKSIFYLQPDFQDIEFIEPLEQEESKDKYSEIFHTEGIEEKTKSLYEKIKDNLQKINANIKINPQRYYISIKDKRNFAFIKLRKKKISIVILLPYEKGKILINKIKIGQLAESVQRFYNRPCFQVILENEENLGEVIEALNEAYKQQNQ